MTLLRWLVGAAGLLAGGCIFGGGGSGGGDVPPASVECLDGAEGCGCYPNGTCNAGLTCASELCVSLGDDAQAGGAGAAPPAGDGSGGAVGPQQPADGLMDLMAPAPTEAAPSGDCSASATVTGVLTTDVADVPFDTVTVEVHHKRDVDEIEDGCLRELVFHLQFGEGCRLDIVAADEIDLQGRMKIKSAEFSADSQCPNFPDDREGLYGGIQAFAFGGVGMEFDNVADYNVAESCIRNTFFIQPLGDMRDAGGRPLTVTPGTDLVVSGSFNSTAADGPCPVREQPPPPPPPPPPTGGSGGGGAGGTGATGGSGGTGGAPPPPPDPQCPAPHMCVVNTTVSSVLVPNACALMEGGFPITCTSAQDCVAAGFDPALVLCVGQAFAFPADYCFQGCNP